MPLAVSFFLQVVSGDYVAYVHIIEVRELKGEDLQVNIRGRQGLRGA